MIRSFTPSSLLLLPRRCRAKLTLVALLTVAGAACPGSARAETAEVTGVAIDDVLNLRAEPNARAALVGALPPTASGIEIERRSDGWAFVRHAGKSGWAAARYLRPARPASGSGPVVPLQCAGTEPFWSLKVERARVVFETPGEQPVASRATVRAGQNRTDLWLSRPSEGPVRSVIIEAGRICSDGMSDRAYPLAAFVELRSGELLAGCCESGS